MSPCCALPVFGYVEEIARPRGLSIFVSSTDNYFIGPRHDREVGFIRRRRWEDAKLVGGCINDGNCTGASPRLY